MDEPRDQPPETNSPRAGVTQLSPLQEAWADYTTHTAGCALCRTVHGGRCEKAVQLWQAHQDLCDDAYRRLSS